MIRKLLRLKDYKDKLIRLIKEADNILIDRKQVNANAYGIRYLMDEPIDENVNKENRINNDLFDHKDKYDEEDFIDRCE